MSRSRVGWKNRVIDAVSLLLIVGGSLLFYRSYVGMGALRARAADATFVRGSSEAFEFLREFARLRLAFWAAMALALLGVGIAIYAAIRERNHVQKHQNVGELRTAGD